MEYSETHSHLEYKINMPVKDNVLVSCCYFGFQLCNYPTGAAHLPFLIVKLYWLTQRSSQTYILKRVFPQVLWRAKLITRDFYSREK
jgi:hypothetical protein